MNVCSTDARLSVTINSTLPVGLKPDMVQDHIELEHVMFNYPSHPNVPVIKGLTILFEAGKTAVLVSTSSFKKRCGGSSFFACVLDADVCHRAQATGYPFRSLFPILQSET